MNSSEFNGTVQEAGLEIESEFYIKANLVDFSKEFKRKFDVLGGEEDFIYQTQDDRKMRQKTHKEFSDDLIMKPGNLDMTGYAAVDLVFQSYFQFQPIIGDKREKEDHKRTMRLKEDELKQLTGHQLIFKIQKAYLTQDDNNESIYPTSCIKLFSNAKGDKQINLNKIIDKSSDIFIKLFDVWHLNFCNEMHIWKAQSDHSSLTDLKNVIDKDDLAKINDQFETKKGDFKKMLIFMNNKKILTENKANLQKTKAFGEYIAT